MFLAFLICAGWIFLKWKGHFSFWGSAFQVFRQCGGASIRTRFCENYFSGGLDFRKTETNLFLDFVRAEEGSGEESARAFWGGLFFPVNYECIHDWPELFHLTAKMCYNKNMIMSKISARIERERERERERE
jgi:hypothetical protein